MAVQLDVSHPVLLAPGEGETVVDQAKRTLRILLSHDLLDVTWTRHEAGERGAEPHVHRRHVDAFYVLEGEMTFRLGPDLERTAASAGTFVAVPPNLVHGFDNDSSERVRFLNFHAPSGGFADYMRGVHPRFDAFDPPEDGGAPAGDAVVSLPGEGERLERRFGLQLIKADLPQLSAIESAFDTGWGSVDPHTHADHVDCFYVLEGGVEFALEESSSRVGPGTFVAAPPGAVHGIRDSSDRGVVLNVHAPDSGFADRLRRRQR